MVVLALLKVAFLGKGDDKRLGPQYGPLSCLLYTLLQILCKVLITASPSACTSSLAILSILGDFPFLSDFSAASTSSRRIG